MKIFTLKNLLLPSLIILSASTEGIYAASRSKKNYEEFTSPPTSNKSGGKKSSQKIKQEEPSFFEQNKNIIYSIGTACGVGALALGVYKHFSSATSHSQLSTIFENSPPIEKVAFIERLYACLADLHAPHRVSLLTPIFNNIGVDIVDSELKLSAINLPRGESR